MRASLEEIIDRERRYAIELLSKMVSIPTINPPGRNYKEFCEFVRAELSRIGIDCRITRVPNEILAKYLPEEHPHDWPRFIALARIGSGRPVLHINGHYDVVPPGHGWTIPDPFKPRIEGQRVYGRGATDMKGGLTSMVLTLKVLTNLERELNGSLEVSFVPDEEIGGFTGTGYLIKSELVNPDYAVIAEPSGENNVYIGHKGGLWVEVVTHGKQAHGSTPWLGINAFEGALKAAQALFNLAALLSKRTTRYETLDPKGRTPTMNIGGVVSGGSKANVVPGIVKFTVDRRLIPEENWEEAYREISDVISKVRGECPGIRYELKILNRFDPCVTDPNSNLVSTITRNIKVVTGSSVSKTLCIGGLDMRFFVDAGIECATYGPGELFKAHAPDEYVRMDGILIASKVYSLTALDLLS